jgi:hypothetical protein
MIPFPLQKPSSRMSASPRRSHLLCSAHTCAPQPPCLANRPFIPPSIGYAIGGSRLTKICIWKISAFLSKYTVKIEPRQEPTVVVQGRGGMETYRDLILKVSCTSKGSNRGFGEHGQRFWWEPTAPFGKDSLGSGRAVGWFSQTG